MIIYLFLKQWYNTISVIIETVARYFGKFGNLSQESYCFNTEYVLI